MFKYRLLLLSFLAIFSSQSIGAMNISSKIGQRFTAEKLCQGFKNGMERLATAGYFLATSIIPIGAGISYNNDLNSFPADEDTQHFVCEYLKNIGCNDKEIKVIDGKRTLGGFFSFFDKILVPLDSNILSIGLLKKYISHPLYKEAFDMQNDHNLSIDETGKEKLLRLLEKTEIAKKYSLNVLEQSKKFRCSGKMKSSGFCGKFLIEKKSKNPAKTGTLWKILP